VKKIKTWWMTVDGTRTKLAIWNEFRIPLMEIDHRKRIALSPAPAPTVLGKRKMETWPSDLLLVSAFTV